MEFRILGPLEVREGDAPLPLSGGRQRALLALLLLNANRVVAAERLIDELWGEEVPETAPKAVQVFVSKLRKVLPEGRLKTHPPGYLIELSEGELDLERFERLLADGRRALAQGRPQEAASLLREALALWRGPALAEFTEPFAQPEAARLEELRGACLEERIEADLALGGHAELVGELESLVGRYPLRERLRAQQLLALYRSGRQAEALGAYQEFRRLLADELGIEPSQRLRDLERRILQQDPELEVSAAPQSPRQYRAPARGTGSAVQVERPAGPERLLVGRDVELGQLCRLLDEALTGERRVVFVTGEAGAGKTTLVESFLGQATDMGDFLLGHGQCVEQHGAGEPYMPVLEALGRLCQGDDGQSLVALLTRRAPTWLAQLPWLLRPDELEALESRTLGATRERMLREMLETLEELTRDRPLVLVLEDLHWSDPSTIDLLEAVARRPDPAQLLVLATFRPGTGASGHPLYGVASNLRLRDLATEVRLTMLRSDAVRDFLALRCPGGKLPARLAEVLHERTGGNPLFMHKVVDSWLEQGSLREQNGAWVLAGGIDALAVEMPDTLRELIGQRLSEVEGRDQELLEAASAAGAEFSAALVAAASEGDVDDVEARLAALARRATFVEATGEEEWPDRTVASRYAFIHDLYQDVLYDLLPAGRRARLHVRIGSRLEHAYGDRAAEIAPELAFHFVRGRDAGRAVRHLYRAAQQALGRSAPREAIEHLSTGLDLLGSLPDEHDRLRWELMLQATLGPAAIAAKGWAAPEAETALLRARELAAEVGGNDEASRVFLNLGTLYEVRAQYDRSDPLLEESLRVAGLPAPPPVAVDSNELLACSLFHQGAFGRALEHAEVGLSNFDGLYANALAATYGDHAGSGCHSWAALALWFLGRPDEALRRAHQAVTLATDPQAAHGLATAQVQVAVVSQCRVEPDATLEWAEAAVASAQVRGFRYRAAMGRILRGWALAAQGSTDAGIAELRGGIELARATGARMDDPYFLGMLADACALAGQHEEAMAAIDEALERVRDSRRYFYEAELHRLRGEVLLGSGRRDDGETSLEQALQLAERQGSAALELRAAVSLGRLRREQGRGDEAASIVASAYAQFTEGFDTPDLIQARLLLEELEAVAP
jgi:DNA-binding SARP family transcriptional activator